MCYVAGQKIDDDNAANNKDQIESQLLVKDVAKLTISQEIQSKMETTASKSFTR